MLVFISKQQSERIAFDNTDNGALTTISDDVTNIVFKTTKLNGKTLANPNSTGKRIPITNYELPPNQKMVQYYLSTACLQNNNVLLFLYDTAMYNHG
jgi:hypothetical protein